MKAETFVRSDRLLGKNPATRIAILRVQREGGKLHIGVAIRREGLKRTYQETANFELLGPELKRFKQAIRRIK